MTDWLDEIKARAEAATPGPWRERECVYGRDVSTVIFDGGWSAITLEPANARFVAHAREDVPHLTAEVRRLRSENEGYKADIEAGRMVRMPAAIGQIVFVPMEDGGMYAPYVKDIAFLRPNAHDAVMEAVATVGIDRERLTFLIAPENKGTRWFETEVEARAALGKEREDG